MPPRYAYWTILIDNGPTAFRARDRADLLPTLTQLRRTNKAVEMKWFARGRLWENPEQAEWAVKNLPAAREKRGRDWRPGGRHQDPRARFTKSTKGPRRNRKHGPTEASRGPGHGPKRHHDGRPGYRKRHGPPRHRQEPFESELRPEPRETDPPERNPQTPDAPPSPEQIVIKPEPPERG